MRVILVGAGGFGREVLGWVRQSQLWGGDATFEGFLDSDHHALRNHPIAGSIVGRPEDFAIRESDRFICAIGTPSVKLRVCLDLRARGATFVNLLHPAAVIGDRVTFGVGCVVCPGAVVTSDVAIGDFVTLNVSASVGHDVRLGDGCTLSGHADVTGGCTVGQGVFLGSHASILPGVTLGDRSVVGAGSVAYRSVPAGATVFGVPARRVFYR